MTKLIKTLIEDANKELERSYKLLEQKEEYWNTHIDLKLHDVFGLDELKIDMEDYSILLNSEQISKYADLFCEDSYTMLNDFVKETTTGYTFSNVAEYIGRTSQFYIGSLHNEVGKDKYLVALIEAYADFGTMPVDTNEDGLLSFDSFDYCGDDEEIILLLHDISKDCYKQTKETLETIEKIYKFITGFKENQVEHFIEYVKCCIEQ